MQIVLLSMDPVFLSPLWPPPPQLFFPLKGGEGSRGEGAEGEGCADRGRRQGEHLLARSHSPSERSKLLSLKKKKKKRQGKKKTKHPSVGLMYRAFES